MANWGGDLNPTNWSTSDVTNAALPGFSLPASAAGLPTPGDIVGGKGGGGSSNFNVTSQTSPWGPQAQRLEGLFADVDALKPLSVSPTGAQTGALTSALGALGGGDTALHRARDVVSGTVGGDFLDPDRNPYLQKTFQRASEQFVNPITSSAVQAGRFGSGAQADQSGEAFARAANQIYGQNYQTERNRQMQAVGMAPQFAFAPEAAQFAIGQTQQQQGIQEQLAPWITAMNRRNLITGNFGQTTTSSGQVPVSGGK